MHRLPLGPRAGLRFIHAGANDGTTNDWLYPSIVAEAWTGICLEPQQRMFELLRQTYANNPRVHPVRGAIASVSGERVLHVFQHPHPRLDAKGNKLASFDRDVLIANLEVELRKLPDLAGTVLADWIREEHVPCYTVAELVREFQLEPDLLALDIEGGEDEILLALDFATFRPEFVFFEAHHLPAARRVACIERLRAAGYRIEGLEEYRIPDFNLLARRDEP